MYIFVNQVIRTKSNTDNGHFKNCLKSELKAVQLISSLEILHMANKYSFLKLIESKVFQMIFTDRVRTL